MPQKNLARSSSPMKALLASALALALAFGSAQSSVAAEYVPPPEAFEGLGGWAVIDPTTGIVYGVIVGNWNEEVWQEVKNTRTIDGYMGCPGPCALRFQTRATADGNVAGWHGTQFHVDGSYSNDGSVRFNEQTGTFEINSQSGSGATTQQTLVPSKTSRDVNGEGTSMDINTGIVETTTSATIEASGESATVRAIRRKSADSTLEGTVTFNGLGPLGTVTINDFDSLESNLESSVISILMYQGFTRTETLVNEESGEETSTQVLDDSNSFVNAILQLSQEVGIFLDSLLGRAPQNP
jgi:opacity protein-like surface antigen